MRITSVIILLSLLISTDGGGGIGGPVKFGEIMDNDEIVSMKQMAIKLCFSLQANFVQELMRHSTS